MNALDLTQTTSTTSHREKATLPDWTLFRVDICYTWIFLILKVVRTNARLVFKLDTDNHVGNSFHTWHGTNDGGISATIKKG